MSLGMRLANAYIEIRANLAPLGAGLAKARTMVQNNLNDIFALSKSMSSIGGMIGGAAVGLGLKAAISQAGNFESAMLRARGNFRMLGDEFDSQFAELNEFAKKLGANTEFTAVQAAESLNRLAKSGFSARQAMEALPGIMSLATASETDLVEATRIAAGTLNAFALEASQIDRVADALASAASRSMTDVKGLGVALSKTGSLSKDFGGEIEDVVAILGVMSKSNVGAAEAGTALSIALFRLSDPPKEAQEALDAMNISIEDFMDSEGKVKRIIPLFKRLQDEMKKGPAGVAQVRKLFGARGKAMNSLFTALDEDSGKVGLDFVQAMADGIRGDTGFADAMRDNIMGGFNKQMTLFMSAVQGAAEAIGSSLFPAITLVLAPIKFLAQVIAQMSPVSKRWVGSIIAAAAAAGTLAFVLPYAIKGVQLLGLAFKSSLGPIGWIAIALGLVVAFFSQVAKEASFMEGIKGPLEELGKAWARLSEAVRKATGGILDLSGSAIWDGIVGAMTSMVSTLIGALTAYFNYAASLWETHGDTIRSILVDLTSVLWATWDVVMAAWNALADALKPIGINLATLGSDFGDFFSKLVGWVLDFVKFITQSMALVTADFGATWDFLTAALSYAVSRMGDYFRDGWNGISVFFAGIIGGMAALITRFADDAVLVFGRVSAGIRATAEGAAAAAVAIAKGGNGLKAYQDAFAASMAKHSPKGNIKGPGHAFQVGFNRAAVAASQGRTYGMSDGSKKSAKDMADALARMEEARMRRRRAIEEDIAEKMQVEPEKADAKEEAEEKIKAEKKAASMKPEFSGVIEMWKKVQNDLFKDKKDADERAAKAAEENVKVGEEQRDVLVEIRDLQKTVQAQFG